MWAELQQETLTKLLESYNDRLESLESRCKKLEENVLDIQYTQEYIKENINRNPPTAKMWGYP